jgi:hypothetical protein
MIRNLFSAILINLLLISASSITLAQTSSQKTIMLILGSDNPQILQHRVNVALRLYHSDVTFDRIIVSGGCGAHSSSICEASRMDSLLALHGVPEQKIFKEEKSKTTRQNYCYSKQLRRKGNLLIHSNDLLYVVSTHWHAIPVAACFRATGAADAIFHIEGSIKPRGPADYDRIFKDCRQKNYCKAILWPQVGAAYFNPSTNKIYYFVDNIYYRKTPGQGIDAGYPKRINQYPGWPEKWGKHVDAAFYNPNNHQVYLFHGTKIISFKPDGTLSKSFPKKITTYFHHWPDNWGAGYIDAAYYNGATNKLFLFKQSSYARFSHQSLDTNFPADIKSSYPLNWPFQWGSGDIDAAYYNAKTDSASLYRGTDYLQYAAFHHTIDQKYPKHTPLPWPKSIWGTKPKLN